MGHKEDYIEGYDENGRPHGISIGYRNRGGSLWWQFNFVHGVAQGLDREWDHSENLWYSAFVNNNIREGEFITYLYF